MFTCTCSFPSAVETVCYKYQKKKKKKEGPGVQFECISVVTPCAFVKWHSLCVGGWGLGGGMKEKERGSD